VIQGQTLISFWRQARKKLDDRSLIKETLDGDKNAFKELVKKYESQVAATVIGMLGPGPEAEDVGQETFIRFYRALAGFRGESSVATYITRIAINLCLNEIKRRGRHRTRYVIDGEKKLESLAHNPGTENRDAMTRLANLGLQRLDPKFRCVIVLRLIDGHTTRETAEILRLPEGTVLSRLARGQQKLKEILSHYYYSKNTDHENDKDKNAMSRDGP
jgi:RNA polymerase sigma-70 factor (ECF subfamily)